MKQASRDQLDHDIKGRMHGLKMCVEVLPLSPTANEKIEFLDDIEQLCDRMDRLMERLGIVLDRDRSD